MLEILILIKLCHRKKIDIYLKKFKKINNKYTNLMFFVYICIFIVARLTFLRNNKQKKILVILRNILLILLKDIFALTSGCLVSSLVLHFKDNFKGKTKQFYLFIV
ncbi:hypothetical protein EDEG_03010 [Edhazardia aedis USNM 41457]|uniref:Uncharacterized protein n=1 Tax=Edhazardia aedis (strain USNM 41457) TaxID=1003232 RepID=J8ZSG9_EDHAE|nr:hypothetical protein EDEG_03010 [Edhazardia aedis USNM 41457]|eukprot:EJW02588.1 hypothetical protein EDEG_03010 [Edhazardia aedis USNM 41457]